MPQDFFTAIDSGTIGTVLGIGGTVQVAGASAGTVVEINKGTINVGTTAVTGVVDITPASPAATDYLPVRLTDASAFYVAGATSEPATFSAIFDRIAPAQNKYVANLFNASSTRKVTIKRIWLYNWNASAVSGVLLEFELRRITARTTGTTITPDPHDSSDSLSANITADHASTSVTDSTILRRLFSTAEETKIAALTMESIRSFVDFNNLIYEAKSGIKGIVLRQNQGIVIKQITNSTVGSVSIVIEFTDEAV